MFAVGLWIALILLTMEVLGLYALGRWWSYTSMGASLFLIFYLCEKIILLERRAFTCKQCGYDLRGLSEDRCPECGRAFERDEREQILARIQNPPRAPKHRWIFVLLVIGLSAAVLAGLFAYRQATRMASRRFVPVPASSRVPSAPNLTGSEDSD